MSPEKEHDLKAPCPDCEHYLAALYGMTRKDFTFSDEEIQELEENGLSLDQVIEELEKKLGT
jgi:hypothetical protein